VLHLWHLGDLAERCAPPAQAKQLLDKASEDPMDVLVGTALRGCTYVGRILALQAYAHKLVHECTHAHLHAFTHIHTFTPAAPQSQTRLPPQQNGRSPANPQLSSAMELQASLASSAKRGRPSDFAPIAGASLSRLLEGQPVKKVGSRSLLGKK
jgi:hypothetical protein